MDSVGFGEMIAERFIAARRTGMHLPDYPGERPADLAEAYRIQDAALRLHQEAVAGWKVGRINPPIGGVDRLAGPIFAPGIVHGDDGGEMPIFRNGFAAVEAEFLLRIGRSSSGRSTFTMDEAADLVDAVHVGIEVASSPYAGINTDGPFVTISDFGNNNGLVVGPAITDWRQTDLLEMPVELLIDGVVAGAATAAEMLDGPIGAVRFLAGHLAGRGLSLEPGHWISTGAVTGVHEVALGQRVEARFGAIHRVFCAVVAQESA